MRRVIITPRYEKISSYDEIRISLDVRWLRFIKELGFTPVVYNDDIKALYGDEISGIIFSGGNNVGEDGCELSRQRNTSEWTLYNFGSTHNIPMIGVCRGAQFIGKQLGYDLANCDNHVANRHKLKLVNESKYLSEFKNCHDVNSFHNYAITGKANDCTVIAKSDDDFIEFWEHNIKPIAGIMWHPERESMFNELDKSLFKTMFKS